MSAEILIIDEAHHFRNPGTRGEDGGEDKRSRYYRLYDLLESTQHRPKTVYMLTATPINNGLTDFRHMIELFSRREEDYFGQTLGINSLRAHFNRMESSLPLLW